MVDVSVKRIRPKDYELSTVQDNLANPLDAVLKAINQLEGSKSVYMGTYSSLSGTMPTSDTALQHTTNNVSKSTFNTTAYGEVMARKGSVTAIKVYAAQPTSGVGMTITLYKNSVAQKFTLATQTGRGYATASDLTYTYGPGDVLQLAVRCNNANAQLQIIGHIEIESRV